MAWDPTDLSIFGVESDPARITNALDTVKITLRGTGFGPDVDGEHMGLFVLTGAPISRDSAMACNEIDLVGDHAELLICPLKKLAGTYDLFFWERSPGNVVDGDGKDLGFVPTNQMAVFRGALDVNNATMSEMEEALKRIKERAEARAQDRQRDAALPEPAKGPDTNQAPAAPPNAPGEGGHER